MAKMVEPMRSCELCNKEAVLFCPSDSAFLCWNCDAMVHSANFLVARHFRSSICRCCRNIDGRRFFGARISPSSRNLCRSCSPEILDGDVVCDGDSDSFSSSSSCVSSTTEAEEEAVSKRREKFSQRARLAVDSKVEGILVNWCRRMAVKEWKSRKVVPTAVEVLGFNRMTVLPLRVSLAAAFWVALRILGGDMCQDLRRVEQISGVPAKLILATESRIARVLKRGRSREDHEEGWAEC